MLLEGVSMAMNFDPQLRLWLVGDGPYRADCVLAARKLGIGDRVKFVGFVPREDVDSYYAAADLFGFASETETQGLVVQEAMLHGLPAVVVAGGGAGESIVSGKNGFVTRNESQDFSATILNILHNDVEYARVSEGARRTARSGTIDQMTQQVLSDYRTAIETYSPAPTEVSFPPSRSGEWTNEIEEFGSESDIPQRVP